MLKLIFVWGSLFRGASGSRLAPFVWFTPACGELAGSAINENEAYSSFKNEWYRIESQNRFVFFSSAYISWITGLVELL